MSAKPIYVLLVTEEATSAEPLRAMLNQAGHGVDHIHSPSQALSLASHASVVVLDGEPATPDLATFCQSLHANPTTAFVPVLLLTDGSVKVIPNGPDSFLCYPICQTQLLSQLDLLRRLRDSQELYRSLVQSLPMAIYRKDADGRFTYVNDMFCAHFHRSPDQFLGRTIGQLPDDDPVQRYTQNETIFPGMGEVHHVSIVELTPEGDKRIFEVVQSPLRDVGGTLVGAQGMFWDVTARKRIEDAAADIELARRVQRQLFPATSSPLVAWAARHGLDMAGGSFPADAIGGDYFDWFPLGQESVGVAIGDVSGHGIGPALLMAETRAYLRASASTTNCPGEVLSLVNQLLIEDIEGDRYVTLLVARIDLAERALIFASAGHSAGYVLDRKGTIRHVLASMDVPLGVHLGQTFRTSTELPIRPGDMVLLLTDGLVEARAPNDQPFSLERVLEVVRYYKEASAHQIVENLYHAVRAFAQNHPQRDDMTALIIKVQQAM
jgi:PAS domain S-box-containing protein